MQQCRLTSIMAVNSGVRVRVCGNKRMKLSKCIS